MAALKIENLITESAMDGVNVSYAGAISDHLDLWTAAVRPKSSAGRGSNSKLELTGIKKLRELILELAVRGKLVPQDPSDEPASVLLERIAAEKAQLVKEKKIKKEKPLPAISEDEKPFELPQGWEWCHLKDIITIMDAGWSPACPPESSPDIDTWGVLKTTAVQTLEYREYENKVLDKTKTPRPEYEVMVGDILITRAGPKNRVGISCLVEKTRPKLMISDKIIRFHLVEVGLSERFISLCLNAGATAVYIDGSKSGMAESQMNISQDKLKLAPIPLGPLKEQNHIMDRVDELMALCDQLEQRSESQLTAHQTLVEALLATLTDSTDADELAQNWARLSTHFDILFTTEASIDALKQTILQLAVMGKLVPQDPSDEPASALLERIAAEKAQLVKEKKIKKEKPLPAISEDEKPFELPQGWEWCHLKDIITIMDAGWSPACPPESSPDIDTWGVLKTTAVQTLEYREYENKVLDKTKTPRPEYEVMVGDILITRAGPKNRVGISCLVEKTRPKLMISDKIIRFHLVEVGLSERFISLCLNAGATAVYIDDSKSGMAESQMNISQDKLKLAPIPLGPIKEQNHIMDRVDQLMTLCDQLKSRLQTSQQTQLALAESLVEGALA
ncbi:restriction endonuclease subunit S [Shewanella xiamenensis]|uniref:Restriction endonuclease subunit S n=2 Tax=Shewanella xiamenensis TaxID=332186 RepID=A0ABT6UA05_9GAMM|nr:restriction endonuclease subunit S [Shewanella xiamenensis]MDI5830159.1 restriction endonuclease subunit S [Shewanella xiamenensis]